MQIHCPNCNQLYVLNSAYLYTEEDFLCICCAYITFTMSLKDYVEYEEEGWNDNLHVECPHCGNYIKMANKPGEINSCSKCNRYYFKEINTGQITKASPTGNNLWYTVGETDENN